MTLLPVKELLLPDCYLTTKYKTKKKDLACKELQDLMHGSSVLCGSEPTCIS